MIKSINVDVRMLCPGPTFDFGNFHLLKGGVNLAKDVVRQGVKNALIKDEWLITDDPYKLDLEVAEIAADLEAENLIAVTKKQQKIVVTIKSFLETSSIISEFHTALGQFINYRAILKRRDPDRVLYLAVPDLAYNTFFSLEFPQLMIEENNLKLIIFEPEKEVIVTWIN